MGGKTQQRVAGNVKPSSSGRTRELLASQLGAANPFVTFSTLNNSIQKKPTNTEKEEDEPKVIEIKPSLDEEKTQNKNQDKPVLVLRRVGNREFYTKVAKNDAETDNIVKVESVFPELKSRQDQEESLVDEINKLTTENLDREAAESEKSETISESDLSETEYDGCDFDTMLDRLCSSEESIEQNIKSLNQMDEQTITKELNLVKLLVVLLNRFHTELSIEEWDIIIQAIHRWVSIISRTDQLIGLSVSKTQLCKNIFKFIYQLKLIAKSCEDDETVNQVPMMESLLDDWNNFSTSKVYQDLLVCYFRLALIDNFNDHDQKLIKAMTSIIMGVDPSFIATSLSLSKPNPITLDPEIFKLPKNSYYCMIEDKKIRITLTLCNLLKKNHRSFIILGHSMLNSMTKSVCETLLLNMDEANSLENTLLLPPEPLFALLAWRDSMMTALLSDFRVGDTSVVIDPKSDSYSCVLSYLLLWDVIIKFIINVGKEPGHCIIHSLKKLGFISRLLDNIFMLLPPPRERLNAPSDYLKNPLKTNLNRTSNEIDLVALHVFFSMACHMPVTVRKWYNNNSNKKLCKLVNEYTVRHISQVICSLEMETVQAKCQERADEDKSNNLLIRARPNAKEVYAIYTRDEFKLELTIKLPLNYPLGAVQIDGGKRVGVTDVKWRGWLLQLTRFLAHQNGPLLDGIDLWRRNIDKRFEGVEKCMICFSILHSNYQLPKKRCQTCDKMFHNLCIYKWFESSGNSTCPLCRNIW